MLLSVHAWTHYWWRTWNSFHLYIPGIFAGGEYGESSICTNLVSLLVKDMEFLFSVYTWTLCYGGQGNLYVSSLSADGGWVNASICMSLDSLLMEDMEMVLFVRTGTLCWRRARNCFSLYVPGLSAGGGHEIASLYVPGLIAGGGQGIASLCTPWTLCWWRTWRWFSLYMPGLSSSGGQGNATLCPCLDSLLVEEKELLLSVCT